MSNKKSKVLAQPAHLQPVAFTIVVNFDPTKPDTVNYNVIPANGSTVRPADVLEAMLLARDDMLIKLARATAQAQGKHETVNP